MSHRRTVEVNVPELANPLSVKAITSTARSSAIKAVSKLASVDSELVNVPSHALSSQAIGTLVYPLASKALKFNGVSKMGECPARPLTGTVAERKKKRRVKIIEWDNDLISHDHIVKKWMTLDNNGDFGSCSLCGDSVVKNCRKFDPGFILKHLCGKRHREEAEKKKHAEAVVAREKWSTEKKRT